jgi:hypothetical protein
MSKHLFIVFLRRPGKNDKRMDPFWEFGSFGCTCCHSHNLLHPKKRHVEDGDCLAFVQGGHEGCKLLLITPPVKRVEHGTTLVEVRWDQRIKPFCYKSKHAPVLARPEMKYIPGALPGLAKRVNKANRSTAEAKLASCFRTSCEPLDPDSAKELVHIFARGCRAAKPADFIRCYTDALPRFNVKLSLKERRRKYRDLLSTLNASDRCGSVEKCGRRVKHPTKKETCHA